MKKIIFTFLLFFIFQSIVLADQEGVISSYTAETYDKKYIFVMLNPQYPKCGACDGYSQSGMYVNDGSMKPLWSVDWLNQVFLPADGEHIVRRGRWARYSANYKEETLSFFSKDKLLKTYSAKDLVDFPWLLPHSSSHYRVITADVNNKSEHDGALMKIDKGEGYPINGGVKINNGNKTISIQTFHNDKYVFDLKTGNIISEIHPSRDTAILLSGILIFSYFVYIFLRSRNYSHKSIKKIYNLTASLLMAFFLLVIPVISVTFNQIGNNINSEELPKFTDHISMSVQMFPKYLLTDFEIISPETENFTIDSSDQTKLKWFFGFWFPITLFFAFLDKVFIIVFSKVNHLLKAKSPIKL